MKKILLALLLLLPSSAYAQKTKATLTTEVNTNFASGSNITAVTLRTTILDIINSYYDLNGTTTLSCAASNWVSALPTLSSITCTRPTPADLSGLGTGVATALGINIGSAGSVLLNGTTAGGDLTGTYPNPSLVGNVVTYGKMQQVTALRLLGNPTGSTANVSEVVVGSNLTFSGGQLQTLAGTGDVTFAANSFVTSIAANAVTNAKLATMNANTVKANATGGSAVPTDVTPATARSSSLLNVDQFTGHGDSIYTILTTDRTVGTNAAFTASRTWTLPAASAVNPGQEIVVADFQGTVTGSNTLVITRAGADTVNGGTSVTIAAANGAYLLKSDGTSKWTAQALGAAAAGGVSAVTCGAGLAGGTITTSGTCTLRQATLVNITTGTYTSAAASKYVWIRACGGSGGGGGSVGSGGSAAGTAGGTGGNTTITDGTTTWTGNGGGGATAGGAGGTGGTATATGGLTYTGQAGQGAFTNLASTFTSGSLGGASGLFGGSDAGGPGGAFNGAGTTGAGGGGPGCFEIVLPGAGAAYTVSIGAAGTAGAAGTGTGTPLVGAAGVAGRMSGLES